MRLRTFAILAIVGGLAGGALGAEPPAPVPLTNIAQIFSPGLPARGLGLPVQLRVTVLYADWPWELLFVQDDTGAMHVVPQGTETEPASGDAAELTGITAMGDGAITVAQPQLRPWGHRPLPQPREAGEEDLLSGKLASQWVTTEAVIRVVLPEEERLHLDLVKGSTRLVSYVRRAPDDHARLAGLVGARVRVTGVCANRYRDNRIVGAGLLIPDMSRIEVIEPARVSLTDSPIVTVAEVKQSRRFGEKAPRLRMQGVVVGQRNSALTLKDATGSIVVSSPYGQTVNLYDRLDAWGFPAMEDQEVLLEDSTLAPVPTGGRGMGEAAIPPPATTLTTVREVRALSREQAATRPPVQLQGLVTYADEAWKHFFLQDTTGAIYVQAWQDGLRVGQIVAVKGVTEPGLVARMIVNATLQPMGETNLPAPVRLSLKDLLSVERDCDWVELDGVVRSVDDAPAHALLQMANREGRFEVSVQGVGGGSALRHLVDAEVRVRGVNTVTVNDRGQFASVQIRAPNPDAIQVLVPAPADPFQIELRPIRAIRDTRTALLGLQRTRVGGVVTLITADGALCVQDATGAILVRPNSTHTLAVGAGVDVVGFPNVERTSTELEQALLRVNPAAARLTPRVTSSDDILRDGLDRELVTIDGRLLNDAGGSAAASLLVQNGPVVFPVRFEAGAGRGPYPVWRANSLVQLTGVVALQTGARGEARSFELLLRSPGDVRVLQSPPWWTPQHAAALGIGLLGLALAGLAWVYLLRRQVGEKTEQVRRRLEAEAALEKRLTLVWENAAEGMCVTDGQGLTLQVNEAYCRLMGKPRPELEDQPFTLVYAENQRAALLEDYRQGFASRAFEPTGETPSRLWDGREVWLEVTRTFFDQPGSSTLALGQFRDVTGRRRAEQERETLQTQLIQAQKMESVGRLAGGVAHDFNNILQVILANASMAMEQVNPQTPLHADLAEIKQAALRSADITRQLLAFARKQTVSPRVLDLNHAIASMLKMLQRLIGEDVLLSWAPGPDVWPVLIDPAQVDQILANLTVNARDAIAAADRPGRISIETANITLAARDARTEADCVPGDYVRLCVRDNGQGMAAEVQEQMFEPFFTTKEVGRGTGLGLATVYGIVKQNRGTIRVESEPGRGTVFQIHLPRATAALPVGPKMHERESARGQETILLVEDEEQILDLGRRILAQRGYTVLAAGTPVEAMVEVDRHSGPIHLLVTDVVMPGMNGRELKQRIEARCPGIQCLFISGYTADIIAHHGVLDEGVQFLAKPFSPQDLATKVRDLLDGRKTLGLPGTLD